jgi:hypothetical protein
MSEQNAEGHCTRQRKEAVRYATHRFDTNSLELCTIKILGGARNLLKIHGSINGHFSGVNLRLKVRRGGGGTTTWETGNGQQLQHEPA